MLIIALAILLAILVGLFFRPGFYAPYAEGRTYVDMAGGNHSNLYSYYAGRVLHPLTAGFVAHLFHTPVDARVFIWISAAALMGLFLFVAIQYGLDYSYAGGLWLFFLMTAAVVDAYRNYYWHDLFYAAVCALFFLALRTNVWMALPVLFLLYLTRESTIILVAAFVLIAAVRREWKICAAAAAVGFVAMRVDAALLARALPNNEGISLVLLDFLKIPYNFIHNILGLELWTNTIAATTDPPIWTMHVPAWLHIGQMREIGYSGFFWENPARTLLALLTAFGILPLVVIRAVARNWKPFLRERFDILTALVYGGLMFALAPLVGTDPERYILYAWPVFWIFGVRALNAAPFTEKKRAEIVMLSLVVAWIPAIVRRLEGPVTGAESFSSVNAWGLVLSLALAIGAYVVAWLMLQSSPAESPARVSPAVRSSVPI